MNLSVKIPPPPDYSSIINSFNSSLNSLNSPASPPALPPPSSYSPLASPTLSGSWNVNKSQAELTSLLKEAYNVIKEKERAEIGKSLLENNMALKAKYEGLVTQYQSLEKQRQREAMATMRHGIPIAPPNNMDYPFEDPYESDNNSDTESINSSYDYSSSLVIKELETRNQDLQARLDEVMREFTDTDKVNKTKIRKIESDLKHYQDRYSQATLKIEDLEKQTENLLQKQKSDFWQLKYDKKTSKNDAFIEALVNKVAELEEQNHHIEKKKSETERKLSMVTNELDLLQEQCNQLANDSQNYEILQMQCRQQTELINDLSESLEYERSRVVSMKSGMPYSRATSRFASRSNSFSEHQISNTLRRLSNPDRSLFGAAPPSPGGGLGGKIKRTLLSELEDEFRRTFDYHKPIEGVFESPPSFSPTSEKSFFFDDSMSLLSDDFVFLDEFDEDKINLIREWFWKRWARSIYSFFRLIWRWAKFLLILIAANLMAIYRGPDNILPDTRNSNESEILKVISGLIDQRISITADDCGCAAGNDFFSLGEFTKSAAIEHTL
ncbi:10231_t:CDS:2 [Entrophospora sp. SA101]|nr:1707_t:CDS:2 [Entrophospora sp. SA101]CAJ0825516.1 10231_t:CDS:2 [Entrophospora sp. SA101]